MSEKIYLKAKCGNYSQDNCKACRWCSKFICKVCGELICIHVLHPELDIGIKEMCEFCKKIRYLYFNCFTCFYWDNPDSLYCGNCKDYKKWKKMENWDEWIKFQDGKINTFTTKNREINISRKEGDIDG